MSSERASRETFKPQNQRAPPKASEILADVRLAEELERQQKFQRAAEVYRRVARNVRVRQRRAGSSPVSRFKMENRHARCAQAIPAPPEIDWHAEVDE